MLVDDEPIEELNDAGMVDLLLDLILAKRVPDVGGPLLLRLLLADLDSF